MEFSDMLEPTPILDAIRKSVASGNCEPVVFAGTLEQLANECFEAAGGMVGVDIHGSGVIGSSVYQGHYSLRIAEE